MEVEAQDLDELKILIRAQDLDELKILEHINILQVGTRYLGTQGLGARHLGALRARDHGNLQKTMLCFIAVLVINVVLI